MRKLLPLLALFLLAMSAVAKPHRVVIEATNAGQFGFRGLLESIENLRKGLAPDPVTIEVVCRGGALDMLLSHANPVASVVQKAQKDGVIFAACGNTMRARHVAQGRLLPNVAVVPAGIAEVVLRQEEGYSYLRE